MCFSALASFSTSALLIPTGIYCLRESMDAKREYLPFSLWPLFFGFQQALEGFVWLGITNHQLNLVHIMSMSFLFFSHFFWLVWVPFSALYLENNKLLRITLIIFTSLGCIYGALLYFPLFNHENLLSVKISGNSINYMTRFIFDDLVPKHFSFTIYAIIILTPLFISSHRRVNILGGQIFVAAIVTYIHFIYAFSSVWCFFTAILSIYIIYILNKEPQWE